MPISQKKSIAEMNDEELEDSHVEERHDEMVKYLRQLVESNKGNDKAFGDAVQSFLAKLKEVSTPNIAAPQVNINNNEVIKAVNDAETASKKRHQELIDIGNKIYECLEQSNELRKLPFEMTPHRDHRWIIKVTGKLIIPTQSKYKA